MIVRLTPIKSLIAARIFLDLPTVFRCLMLDCALFGSVLSSDLGQANNPLHPDGLLAMYQYLASQGISIADIDRMAKVNPAKLLGLK